MQTKLTAEGYNASERYVERTSRAESARVENVFRLAQIAAVQIAEAGKIAL